MLEHLGHALIHPLLLGAAVLVLPALLLREGTLELLLVLEAHAAQLRGLGGPVGGLRGRSHVHGFVLGGRARGHVRPALLGEDECIALDVSEDALHAVWPAVRVHAEGLGVGGGHGLLLLGERLRKLGLHRLEGRDAGCHGVDLGFEGLVGLVRGTAELLLLRHLVHLAHLVVELHARRQRGGGELLLGCAVDPLLPHRVVPLHLLVNAHRDGRGHGLGHEAVLQGLLVAGLDAGAAPGHRRARGEGEGLRSLLQRRAALSANLLAPPLRLVDHALVPRLDGGHGHG
mmetsp:Transcript_16215/g.47292  ORF Transcript_16215/g.47292 Transcript_16215/m.47292 type:complete len:287 (-) Transcript_16215:680-1540(-)